MGCRKPQSSGSMEMHDLGSAGSARAAAAATVAKRDDPRGFLGIIHDGPYLRNGRRETTAIRSSFVRTASQRAMAKSAL